MKYYKDINNIVNDMLTIGNETEKREKELMEEEKRYYADIKITWGVSFNARNKEEAIEYLKEQYKDDYGIDLNDDEIIKLQEEK